MTHFVDLNAAVEAGIISLDQAKSLETIGKKADKTRADKAVTSDEANEPFRLIGGFNDIFVTIGLVLFLVGFFVSLSVLYEGSSLMRYGVTGLLIWGLAEYISRIKRMKLPSTILALAFMLCTGALLGIWLEGAYSFASPENTLQALEFLDQIQMSGLLSFSVLLGVSLVYFWRFRVPVQAAFMALAATGIVTVVFSELFMERFIQGRISITSMDDLVSLLQRILLLPLFCGAGIFLTGLYLDIKDRKRLTTLSDSAFWLHLISAPMLVHPLFMMARGEDMLLVRIEPGFGAQFGLFALVLVIVFISLAIDRRALLIPTLAYFGSIGIYQLINSASESTGIPAMALVLFVVGALIIVLGVGWQTIRSAVLGRVLPSSWLGVLPPLKSA